MAPDHYRMDGIEGRGGVLVVLSIIFTGLALALVSSRVHIRRTIVGQLGSDDVASIFSMLFSCGMGTSSCIAVVYGYGNSSMLIAAKDLHKSLLIFYLIQIFYKLTIASTKISILLLYLRIFPGRQLRLLDYALLTFVSCYAVASITATIVQCHPVAAAWNHDPGGKCINLRVSWYFNGGADMIGDILILLLPMRSVIALQLPRRQKIGLIIIFALGGFVCFTSAMRMMALKTGAKSSDPNRGTLGSTVWTIVEADTGIICACLPMLRAPFGRMFPGFFSRNRSNTNSRSKNLGHKSQFIRHWDNVDQARQQFACPEPCICVASPTHSSSNEEMAITKTTNIDVEITSEHNPLSPLHQCNASNGFLTMPGAVHLCGKEIS